MSLFQTSTTTEPALELRGVEVPPRHGGSASLLREVDWSVEVKDFWVVGGLLNSGKTRLLETAAGMVTPRSGTVKLLGREIRAGLGDEEVHHRLKLGLVHDGGLLFRALSVAENISLPLRYHHNATPEDVQSRLERWLDATGLKPRANLSAGTVGRNWAQRAGLARACILEPEVLLLDNPLTGLDPQHARWWLEMLQQIHQGHPLVGRRPMTVVVTCDDFRPWFGSGRKYARLHEGRLEVLNPDRGAAHLNELLIEGAALPT